MIENIDAKLLSKLKLKNIIIIMQMANPIKIRR